MDYPKKINFRRYAVYILAAWLLLLYLVLVLTQYEVYDSVVVEGGQTSFVAAFETVEGVVAANTDPEVETLLEEYPISMTIEIQDKEGETAAYLEIASAWIATDGFVSLEDFPAEGSPFQLDVGETYTILRYAYVNGSVLGEESLEQFSFVIYGEAGGMEGEAILLGILALIVMAGLLMVTNPAGEFRNRPAQEKPVNGRREHETADPEPRRGNRARFTETAGYIAIYLAIAVITLISVPAASESAKERTAFAEAYSFSSFLLGRDTSDGEGYVYIEENGIRMMGQMSQAQSLHRFWNNWSDGNQRSEGETCTLYQVDSKIPSPAAVLDGTAIAVARICRAPYQLVYLAGPLLNLGIGFVIYLAVLRILMCRIRKGGRRGSPQTVFRPLYQEPFCLLCLVLFLLPSVMNGLTSYRGYGLCIAALMLILLVLREYLASRTVWLGILCAGSILCVIGLVRILLTGANPVLVLVRSIVNSADDWLYGIVYDGPAEEGELTLACLLLLMMCGALAADAWQRGRRQTWGDPDWPTDRFAKRNVEHAAQIMCGFAVILSGSLETLDNGRIVMAGLPTAWILPLVLASILQIGMPDKLEEEALSEDMQQALEYDSPDFPETSSDTLSDAGGERSSDARLRYRAEILVLFIVYIGFCSVGERP